MRCDVCGQDANDLCAGICGSCMGRIDPLVLPLPREEADAVLRCVYPGCGKDVSKHPHMIYFGEIQGPHCREHGSEESHWPMLVESKYACRDCYGVGHKAARKYPGSIMRVHCAKCNGTGDRRTVACDL